MTSDERTFMQRIAARNQQQRPTEPVITTRTPPNGQTPTSDLPASWFLNALAGEADELAHTTSGRNSKLNYAAWRIGGMIKNSHGTLTEQLIIDTLTAAGRQASSLGDHPFPDSEIATTLRSALPAGIANNPCPLPAARTQQNNTPSNNAGSRQLRWTTASQVQDAVPVWAWCHSGHGRIQLGTLTLFAGRPGAGKSSAARWFAAQVTKGQLEGHWHHQPQHVAYIAAEESTKYTITPGLRAAHADLTKIHYPAAFRDNEPTQLLSTLDETDLIDYLNKHHITVVIVDPLMSTIAAVSDINKNNEVRTQIQPWARIADTINGIVIGVAHLRKNNTGDVIAAVTGSSAFGEVARAVFGFAKNTIDDTRVMSQHKNSTGYEDLSLAYTIESESVTVSSGEIADVGVFKILGPSEITVEDILSEGGYQQGGAGVECQRWLHDYLSVQGPVRSQTAKQEAQKEGYPVRTVERAAKKLKVVMESRDFPRATYWSLPTANSFTDPSQSRQQSRHE